MGLPFFYGKKWVFFYRTPISSEFYKGKDKVSLEKTVNQIMISKGAVNT